MHRWLKLYPLLFVLLCAGYATAAKIQDVPLIPRALQGADKVPVDYAGNGNAYTASMDQIKTFIAVPAPPSLATSSNVGLVKPDGTTTTVDGNGTLHAPATYPNPGIPYSLGNGWGIAFTPSNKIPANYVALPVIPATKAPCGVGYHLDSYDSSSGQFTCSADASTGGSTDYNAVHLSAAGEYAGVASKTTPDGADLLLVEDSANGNTKKRINVNSLPYQAQGSYLSTAAIGSTVQPYSSALSAVSGTNTGDETRNTIMTKIGAAGPSDGYLTAAQYVTLSNALQPTSTLDATKLSGTTGVNTTGNAATATKLATPRAINGVNFDGTAPITINAVDSTPRVAQTTTVNGHPLSANVTVTAADAGALAISAQAADSAKLATVTPSANALTLIGHTFSQMVTDLSTALNAAYHGLTILSSEITTALGFTPENVANKSNDAAMTANSSTLYPTQAAVRTYVANNGGGGSSAVFKVYTSNSWQSKTGYVWYRGTGDPDPTSSMGPYDILNDATATSTYTDVTSLFTGTGPCYLKSDGTCANPTGAGTVTSVAATVPAFLTVAGSPVTGNGTLAFSLASGYYVPSTGDQNNWNAKQTALTSGSNIKTVSGVSLMGSGDVGTIDAAHGGTGVTDISFSSTTHKVASVGFVNPASNKCVEVDSTGKLQIAGSNATCGSGGSGLSTSLTAGHVYVGNSGGTATDTAISGDGTLSSTGALTITKSGGTSFGSNAFTSTVFQTPQTTLAGYGITDAYTKTYLDSALNGKLGTTAQSSLSMGGYNVTGGGVAGFDHYSTTSPNGKHRMNVRNTVAITFTPTEGDIYTDSTGKLWIYTSSAWVEKGAAYTLPTAGASTLGGVKIGSGLTIDGSGVLSATSTGGTGSAMITAAVAGDAALAAGTAYISTATGRWTFRNYTATSQTTIFANYSGTLCAATGSKLFWPNPTTFANLSGACAKVPPNTRMPVQMLGGKTYAIPTRNLTPRAAASGGGGGTYADSFTGTDGTLLTTYNSQWTQFDGSAWPTSFLALKNNQLNLNNNYGSGGAYYAASTSDTSQIIIKPYGTTAGTDKGVLVRCSVGVQGYDAEFRNYSGGNWTAIQFRKNGTFLLAPAISISASVDHTLKLVASGTSTVTLTAYVDGVQVGQTTDSTSPITSGHPGFFLAGNGVLADNYLDSWQDY